MSKRKAALAGLAVGTDVSLAVLTAKPTGQAFGRVLVSELAPDPGQPRKSFDQSTLLRLALSLRERGQLQPVLVRPRTPDDDVGADVHYILVTGERRWRAAPHAGLVELDALIDYDRAPELSPQSRVALLLAQLAENLERDDLSRGEVAGSLLELEALGVPRPQLAEAVHRSGEWVKTALLYARLASEARALMDERDFSMDLARYLSPLPVSDQVAAVRALPDGRRHDHLAILSGLRAEIREGRSMTDALAVATAEAPLPSPPELVHPQPVPGADGVTGTAPSTGASTQGPRWSSGRRPGMRWQELRGGAHILRISAPHLPIGRLPGQPGASVLEQALIETIVAYRDALLGDPSGGAEAGEVAFQSFVSRLQAALDGTELV